MTSWSAACSLFGQNISFKLTATQISIGAGERKTTIWPIGELAWACGFVGFANERLDRVSAVQQAASRSGLLEAVSLCQNTRRMSSMG